MYNHVIIFLHVLSAFVWVGGMILVRLVVHPALQTIEEPKIKLCKTLEITGRLFMLVIPFIVTLLVSGVMMMLDTNGHHGGMSGLFVTKEAIWSIMAINFAYMFMLRRSAWRMFEAGELSKAKAKVKNIPNLLLPINIILGIVALWFGVSLRGV